MEEKERDDLELRQSRYSEDYVLLMEKFKSLRESRNIGRRYVSEKLGLNYENYYKKEAYFTGASFDDFVNFYRVIGFELMPVATDDIFIHKGTKKKYKREEY